MNLPFKSHIEYPEQTISIPGMFWKSTANGFFCLNDFSLELLKAHRQEYLYSKYNMVEIPLLDSEVDERYQSQVISTYVHSFYQFYYYSNKFVHVSPDIMEKETLVLLVHQLYVKP